MESVLRPGSAVGGAGGGEMNGQKSGEQRSCGGSFQFQMPVHYPRYTKAEYETMPEWQLDRLLAQYDLPLLGDVEQKRRFAIGAFLWPY